MTRIQQIPCLFFCLAALTVWLNFAVVGAGPIFVYWPVILIGISALILFLPAPVLYHSSRRWFLASCVRPSIPSFHPPLTSRRVACLAHRS